MTELRNRVERRHQGEQRFDHDGSPVGDHVAMEFLECIDCGELYLVMTGVVGEVSYHFPMAPEDCLGVARFMLEAYMTNQGIGEEGS